MEKRIYGRPALQAVTGNAYDMEEIKALYLRAAQQVFGWEFSPVRKVSYDQVESDLAMEAHVQEPLEVPTAGFEPATPGSGGQCSIP